ncbi:MAG: hypothetical protein U0805_02295 [Pirellulales bacterium]
MTGGTIVAVWSAHVVIFAITVLRVRTVVVHLGASGHRAMAIDTLILMIIGFVRLFVVIVVGV